jgi:hypothetical protein
LIDPYFSFHCPWIDQECEVELIVEIVSCIPYGLVKILLVSFISPLRPRSMYRWTSLLPLCPPVFHLSSR